jgi:hypothetical protein
MLCKQHEETIYNLISECPILAKNEYVMRHDTVGAQLQYSICKALGIETTGKLCTHTHTHTRARAQASTVLWHQEEHKDKEVMATRSDIIMKKRKEKRAYWQTWQYQRTEMSHKRKRKEPKYNSLRTEIQRIRNVKSIITTEIIGATEMVKNI